MEPVENSVFEATLGELRPRLASILRRYRVPADDAEDLLQEAYLSLFFHWQNVRERAGYLVVTVARLCRRYHYKRHRLLAQAVDEAVLELLAEPLSPPQEQVEARHDVQAYLADLTPKRRRAVYQCRILGLTPEEVSDSQGVQPDATRRLLRFALEALARKAGKR